jgi:protein gp37
MSEITKISWADSTVNFWSGCTKVSPGCANCYAEKLSDRNMKLPDGSKTIGSWGKGAPRKWHNGAVKQAMRLNRKPWFCFRRRRIFSLSLGDWLDPEVPVEWLAEMLDTIRKCDSVDWLLCTKRPELFFERLRSVWASRICETGMQPFVDWLRRWGMNGKPPAHVWLLTSVENQEQANKRIPELMRIPAVVRGISLEPLLGPVSVEKWLPFGDDADRFVDWLVIGGESGHEARPCNVEWIRDLVKQGRDAGVAVHVKQLGANVVGGNAPLGGVGTFYSMRLKDKKGGDPAEWPEDLRVREWPEHDWETADSAFRAR